MKVRVSEQVESAHAWVDQETGKIERSLVLADEGDVLDSAEMEVGDAERALSKLVKLGFAEEV